MPTEKKKPSLGPSYNRATRHVSFDRPLLHQDISTGFATERVQSQSADEQISAGTAEQEIRTAPAMQQVIARAAAQAVGTAASEQASGPCKRRRHIRTLEQNQLRPIDLVRTGRVSRPFVQMPAPWFPGIPIAWTIVR